MCCNWYSNKTKKRCSLLVYGISAFVLLVGIILLIVGLVGMSRHESKVEVNVFSRVAYLFSRVIFWFGLGMLGTPLFGFLTAKFRNTGANCCLAYLFQTSAISLAILLIIVAYITNATWVKIFL
jgi:hypothetical protein